MIMIHQNRDKIGAHVYVYSLMVDGNVQHTLTFFFSRLFPFLISKDINDVD